METIVVNTAAGHNKFWAARTNQADNTVHIRWGRLGTTGQTQIKNFATAHGCESFIRIKASEKMRKGYTNKWRNMLIDQNILDKLSMEAAIVGTSNKCDDLRWVELVGGKYVTIPDDRLQHPDCNPAISVTVTTKKEYNGKHKFNLLFTIDKVYLADENLFEFLLNGTKEEITKQHFLYQFTANVEQAIGHSLSC